MARAVFLRLRKCQRPRDQTGSLHLTRPSAHRQVLYHANPSAPTSPISKAVRGQQQLLLCFQGADVLPQRSSLVLIPYAGLLSFLLTAHWSWQVVVVGWGGANDSRENCVRLCRCLRSSGLEFWQAVETTSAPAKWLRARIIGPRGGVEEREAGGVGRNGTSSPVCPTMRIAQTGEWCFVGFASPFWKKRGLKIMKEKALYNESTWTY